MALTLTQIAGLLPGAELRGDGELCIERLAADSRECGPGVLFVAVIGSGGDGHRYLEQAAASGSPAIVVQRGAVDEEVLQELRSGKTTPALILCEKSRPVPAWIARELNARPDQNLLTAGVTGTNGKTTVTFLLRELMAELSGSCGLIGTIQYDDGRVSQPAPLTTPGGPVFYEWLARMVANRCAGVAMEISSHALDQDRTAGLELNVAVMTNLGRDHLDYHHDLEQYLAAKARILDLLRATSGCLALNVDDPALAGLATNDLDVIRFSTGGNGAARADLVVHESTLGLDGTRLRLRWHGQELEIKSPLVGRFNVENLTAALAAGIGLGFAPEDCAAALAGVDQVPGRLERIALPNGALAVVDYAHTHDALEAVLRTCDELTDQRVMTVFGCGGDRDQGKRSLMGAVAARCSDAYWITSDNPRSEDPQAICEMVAAGAADVSSPRAGRSAVIVDRRQAIEAALSETNQGDIVVIAGKGHEDYQLIGDRILELDDRCVVRDWIAGEGDHV